MLRNYRHKVSIAVLTLIIIILSCGYRAGTVVVLPPKIDMKKYSRLVIAEVKGKNNAPVKKFERDLTEYLLNEGVFEVMDRKNVQQFIDDVKFNIDNPGSEKKINSEKKLRGSTALIFIEISKYSTDKKEKSKKVETNTDYTIRFKAELEVFYKLVDFENSRIITTYTTRKEFSETYETTNKKPLIDTEKIFASMIKYSISSFVKEISPTVKKEKIVFDTDSDLPELERAVSLIKIKEYNKALEILKAAAEKYQKHEKAHILYYNMGVVHILAHNYAEALVPLKKAYELKDKGRYQKWINRGRKMDKLIKNYPRLMKKVKNADQQ